MYSFAYVCVCVADQNGLLVCRLVWIYGIVVVAAVAYSWRLLAFCSLLLLFWIFFSFTVYVEYLVCHRTLTEQVRIDHQEAGNNNRNLRYCRLLIIGYHLRNIRAVVFFICFKNIFSFRSLKDTIIIITTEK